MEKAGGRVRNFQNFPGAPNLNKFRIFKSMFTDYKGILTALGAYSDIFRHFKAFVAILKHF
jgi:hypothetical protein